MKARNNFLFPLRCDAQLDHPITKLSENKGIVLRNTPIFFSIHAMNFFSPNRHKMWSNFTRMRSSWTKRRRENTKTEYN